MFSRVKHPCQRPPVTLHGVVFDILVGSENRVGLAAVFPEMILRVACRAVARVQRGPPSPDGLWRGSLRYEIACPADACRLAEREGFEPPIGLHLCRISSAVHSTTLPPLQGAKSGSCPVVGAVF